MTIEYGKAPAFLIKDVTVFHTTAEWMLLDPIISKGTFCIEELKSGYYQLKIADGVNKWSNLNNVLNADAPAKSYSNTILAGNDTINLPWTYDLNTKNILIFLGGVKQNNSVLTFVDNATIRLSQVVPIDTEINVVLLPESIGNMLHSKGYNHIIDGKMNLWELGTIITSSDPSQYRMAANMWRASVSANATRTFSRQSFSVGEIFPDGVPTPKYFSRTDITNSGTLSSDYTLTSVDCENVTLFNNRKITIRFKARCLSGNRKMSVEPVLISKIPSETYIYITPIVIDLTSSWQSFTLTFDVPSISTLDVSDTSMTFLRWNFWMSAGSLWNGRSYSLGFQTGVFDLADVSVVVGDESVFPLERPEYVDHLLSLRYLYVWCDTSERSVWDRVGYGKVWLTNRATINLQLPTNMRIKDPTLVAQNVSYLTALDGVNSSVVSAMYINNTGDATKGFVEIVVDCVTPNLVVGRPALVYCLNSILPSWWLDCRF